jgi:hypothetical protein
MCGLEARGFSPADDGMLLPAPDGTAEPAAGETACVNGDADPGRDAARRACIDGPRLP